MAARVRAAAALGFILLFLAPAHVSGEGAAGASAESAIRPGFLDPVNHRKFVESGLPLPAGDAEARSADALMHVAQGPPRRVGNHAPLFALSGDIIEVKEDSGPFKLGAQFAVMITDSNGDTQSIWFECANDNPELFVKQPDIVACPINFCVGTMEVPPGTGTLVFTPRTDRFGTAVVRCRAVDSGIAFPVCNGPPGPTCIPVACDTPGAGCNESPTVEFTVVVTKVNDQPEFVHDGDIVSPEDVEQCIKNWASEVTAGGWEEDFGRKDSQTLTWVIQTDNPELFKTQPYIKYQQGARTGDLCFTPADDMAGVASAQVYLSDSGGRGDGGVDSKPPETITITILEVNDPPTFTAGDLFVKVDEDSGPVDLPWATDLSPGPPAEIRAMQQLDRFVLDFLNPAHADLFKVQPVIDVNTGHLSFESREDVNTFGIDVAMTVHLIDSATPPDLPAKSEKPWPVLHIEITPVNDPPSFRPPQPKKDVSVLEGAALVDFAWARDVCVGKAPPNCVDSEGFAGGENQKVYFKLSATNKGLFEELPVMSPAGLLSFKTVEDKDGASTITVRQFDTGPEPNEGPVINFVITVLPVNDPPRFDLKQRYIELEEDSTDVLIEKVLDNLSPGPEAEWGQRLSSVITTSWPGLFEEPNPEFVVKSQRLGPTYADLKMRLAENRFGFSNLTFFFKDDGGTEHSILWTAEVQKDSEGMVGVSYTGIDVTEVDPDGTGFAAGVRPGMKIKSVDGNTVTNDRQLRAALAAAPATGKFPVVIQNGTDVAYGPPILVHVTPVNDPPEFLRGKDLTVVEDNPASLCVFRGWAHKNSPGPFEDGLQRIIHNFTVDPPEALRGIAINAAGTLNFTVARDFFGGVDVSVRVNDAALTDPLQTPLGDWSAPQKFHIAVLPVNDPPIFEINPRPVKVLYCPLPDVSLAVNCTRDYPGWAWDIRAGPLNERNQQFDLGLSADTGLDSEDWVNLFEPHHYPTVTESGSLHFTLKRGALPAAYGKTDKAKHNIVRVKVRLHDDGGRENGGINENVQYFDMEFSDEVATPSPVLGPSSLTVVSTVYVAPGQTYVTPPLVRALDSTGAVAPLLESSLIKFLLVPIDVPSIGAKRSAYTGLGGAESFSELERAKGVQKFLIKVDAAQGGVLHSFSPPNVGVYQPGTYQYVVEVHLPDGHVLSAADKVFAVKAGGSVTVEMYTSKGEVISGRSLNEWDVRLSQLRFVLSLVGNEWRPAATRTKATLSRTAGDAAAAAAPQRAASTLQVNLTSGTELTTLASSATIVSPTSLSLSLEQHPIFNIAKPATLEVTFPAESVGGSVPPPPLKLELMPAPTLKITAPETITETHVRGSAVQLELELARDTWVEVKGGPAELTDFPYVLDALSSSVFQANGFNALKRSGLVKVTRASGSKLLVTLGPSAAYEISEDEVLSIDPALLRVTSGVQPDFDFNPSNVRIVSLGTSLAGEGGGAGGGWKPAGTALGVVVTLAALAAATFSSPAFLCSGLAVPFMAQACGRPDDGSASPTSEVLRGLLWWVRPQVLKLGADASQSGLPPVSYNVDRSYDSLSHAQGAVVLLLVAVIAATILHLAVVVVHWKTLGAKRRQHEQDVTPSATGSFLESAKACRFPSLLVVFCVPVSLVLFHNCMFVAMDDAAKTTWRLLGVLIGVLSVAAAGAFSALAAWHADRIAAYYDTSTWKGGGEGAARLRRLVYNKGFYASHNDPEHNHASSGPPGWGRKPTHEELAQKNDREGVDTYGEERRGSSLASYTPGKVYTGIVAYVWLALLAALSAHSAQHPGDRHQKVVMAVFTGLYALTVAVSRPHRSTLLHSIYLVCLGCVVLIAVGGTAGAVIALLTLCFFAVLFLSVFAVSVCVRYPFSAPKFLPPPHPFTSPHLTSPTTHST